MTKFKTTQNQFDQIFDNLVAVETISSKTKDTAIQMVKQMIDDVERAQSKLKGDV